MAGDGIGKSEEFGAVTQCGPGGQGALTQRQLGIANEHGRVGPALDSQSLAGRAPAERTIKREMVRVQRLEATAAAVACKMLAITLDFPILLFLFFVDKDDVDHSLAQVQGRLHPVGHSPSTST